VNTTSDHNPQAFFRDLRAAFGHTLQDTANGPKNVDSALQQAWDSFDGNLAIQCEGQPPIACHKGCPSCCTLRVGVLAPEVFMVAAYLRATATALQSHGINLIQRIREADAVTRGLDEVARVALNRRCAYIEQGVCLIHRVRPLACRGHASYDKRACVEAAAGRVNEVPFSGPHQLVRSLVQSALQAALRAQGLAWGTYEMNHALVLALDDEHADSRWLAGSDPLAAAAMDAQQREAMAAWFDETAITLLI
jgi:Fe-S-cluster containining protein